MLDLNAHLGIAWNVVRNGCLVEIEWDMTNVVGATESSDKVDGLQDDVRYNPRSRLTGGLGNPQTYMRIKPGPLYLNIRSQKAGVKSEPMVDRRDSRRGVVRLGHQASTKHLDGSAYSKLAVHSHGYKHGGRR